MKFLPDRGSRCSRWKPPGRILARHFAIASFLWVSAGYDSSSVLHLYSISVLSSDFSVEFIDGYQRVKPTLVKMWSTQRTPNFEDAICVYMSLESRYEAYTYQKNSV